MNEPTEVFEGAYIIQIPMIGYIAQDRTGGAPILILDIGFLRLRMGDDDREIMPYGGGMAGQGLQGAAGGC